MSTKAAPKPEIASSIIQTGIEGLDDILGGGLSSNRIYLVHGNPGAGKTTLAMQCLLEGVKQGETVMYVTLSETERELKAVAQSHGWSPEKIHIYEMGISEKDLEPENQYTIFQPSEVELSATTKAILEQFERINPTRLVLDSLSEIRLLAQNTLRYRRQILALKQYFSGRNTTVLLLDDKTSAPEDLQLESIAHGVISLEQLSPEYGAARRRLIVSKYRGARYRGGYHDFIIQKGGIQVFPRLVAAQHYDNPARGKLESGLKHLDQLLDGGIQLGTSMLLLGPAGSGKSTTAIQYAIAAAQRGERSALFTFDERVHTMMERANGLGLPLEKYVKEKLITIASIDPAELSPGEFAHCVFNAAEGKDGHKPARIIVIDSLNGYMNAMPEERHLTAQLHELLTYLGHKGIVTFLVVAQHGLLGQSMQTPIDTSYLADSVLLFRYFEAQGEVKQLISVLKKRSGNHERTLREFKLEDKLGIRIGEPLRQFQGLLTGTPRMEGLNADLMKAQDE